MLTLRFASGPDLSAEVTWIDVANQWTDSAVEGTIMQVIS
jgi:hypothetical protein